MRLRIPPGLVNEALHLRCAVGRGSWGSNGVREGASTEVPARAEVHQHCTSLGGDADVVPLDIPVDSFLGMHCLQSACYLSKHPQHLTGGARLLPEPVVQ